MSKATHCVRARCRPGEFEEIGKVSEKELLEALRNRRKQHEEAISGKAPESENISMIGSNKLLKQVKVSQSYMWGSSEERLLYRRQAFSMDAFLKTGAIFLTITPSEDGTLSIMAAAGRVCDKSLDRLQNGDLPNDAMRRQIATTDPVACFEYFDNICETLITDVIRFNRKTSTSYRGGGIFGKVRSFLGVVEAQQSRTLHLHAVLFVSGLPRTIQEFSSQCEDKENGEIYKQSVCNFVDSVVRASLHVSPKIRDEPQCPHCKAECSLIVKKKVSSRAFGRHRHNSKPEHTAVCVECRSGFGGSEVLRSELMRLHDSLDSIKNASVRRMPLGSTHIQTDRLTKINSVHPLYHVWPTGNESPDSEIGRLFRLFTGRVALLTQQHNYRHVESCFKRSSATKDGECRYGFPRPSVDTTHINEDMTLVLQRTGHNEYINGFNEVLLSLFRTNHDIRFLLGGTSEVLYYVLKYVKKSNDNQTAAEDAILDSFERRCRIERETDFSEMLKVGRARVNSMAIALSKKQEVPSTMCALYLKRKTALYSSHTFAKLMLAQSMAIIRKQEHDSELVRSNDGSFVRACQHIDYIFRPQRLENVNLIEFVSGYKRIKKPGNRIQEADAFDKNHPLAMSHVLILREPKAVPEIIGPRIPDMESKSKEDRENLGLISLILFRPFRRNEDLTYGTGSFWGGFELFSMSGDISQKSKETFENMQEYYVSKKTSSLEQKTLQEFRMKYTEDNDSGSETHVSRHIHVSALDQNEPVVEYDIESGILMDNSSSVDMALKGLERTSFRSLRKNLSAAHIIQADLCSALSATHFKTVLKHGEVWTPIGGCVDSLANSSCFWNDKLNVAHLEGNYRQLIEKTRSFNPDDSACQTGVSCEPHLQRCETNFSVDIEKLATILSQQELPSDESAKQSTLSDSTNSSFGKHRNMFLSPEEVANKFSLNELQRKAFFLAARALLERISLRYKSFEGNDGQKPFSMYLGGEGGTGKTRVVEALLFLCKSWNRPLAVRTCAPTGIAASLVRGQTVHSLLGIRAGKSFNPRKKISDTIREEHMTTLMLIIDEISMLTLRLLGALDLFFRKVKECDVAFGGIAVVLSGDFFQIPPVASEPVFRKPQSEAPSSLEFIGYHFWKSVNYGIILKESMRHSEDVRFAECLRRIRVGRPTDGDLALLNSRVMTRETLETCSFKGNVHTVVRTNEMRMLLNWKTIAICSERTKTKPILCVAVLRTENDHSLLPEDIEKMMTLNDSETSNMLVILPLLPSMPIRLTQNISVALGLANGAQGVLAGWSYEQGTSFREMNLYGIDCIVCSRLPQVAYISSDVFRDTVRSRYPDLPPQYDDNTLPVVPKRVVDLVPRKKWKLNVQGRVRMTQLPFVPSFASTTYKIQGSTVDGIISFPLVGVCKSPPASASLYVVLSRVRKLSSLLLTERLQKKEMKVFTPSDELLVEDKRLRALHEKTVSDG